MLPYRHMNLDVEEQHLAKMKRLSELRTEMVARTLSLKEWYAEAIFNDEVENERLWKAAKEHSELHKRL